MPLHCDGSLGVLSGVVSIEEVEPLVAWLQATPLPEVDLHECRHLHAAALQALLVHAPALARPAQEPFLAAWVNPLLVAAEPTVPPLATSGPEAGPTFGAEAGAEAALVPAPRSGRRRSRGTPQQRRPRTLTPARQGSPTTSEENVL